MADLHRLLDVQDRDLALDQLRHRHEHLPERAALADLRTTLTRLDTELTSVEARLHDIEVAQRKLEDEVASLDAKVTTETAKLNSGSITAPREIQALSEEVDALGRRKRVLEDQELDLMEEAEPLAATVERLNGERDTAAAEVERLGAAVSRIEAEIDAEVERVRGERAAAAADITAELLERYEKLRTRLGGIGAARLDGDRCLGCHISLPAMEVDAIRHAPPDAVVTHEECGRILVR
ncbi:MAG TPA: C4-type zinc ribbon domain-containing protein [Acidimicrobiales bacterium]|nr:C4-type zinc ribbon domain-containing protein [Acidimicrobiales bacterium]